MEMSYVSGTSDLPLVHATIGQLLSTAAEEYADREALVSIHQSLRYTYSELDALVNSYAAGFLACGMKPGDRVGIWSPNNAEWVITQFATARAGLILVNINPAYRLNELEYALNKTGCKGLVSAKSFKTSNYVGMVQSLAPEIEQCEPGQLQSEKLPDLKLVAVIGGDEDLPSGFMNFEAISAAATKKSHQELIDLQPSLDADDAINIQFTSGTTGFPKGATLSHHNIINNGRFCGDRMKFQSGDRLCIPVPLYHCFGMVLGVLTCVSLGATMVLPDEAFEAASVLQAVQDEKCTGLFGVPTMFIAELDHPDFEQYDLSTLRTGVMAGSPCPIEVMKRVISDMNMVDVTIGYGMTELSPLSFQTCPEDSLEKSVTTVGRAHPFVETKIVNKQGQVVPRGVQGEILSRGYSVMKGYWNDEERTAEARDAEGWMHTGDLGVIDDEGYCKITGRSKDMIIRGGENIYPREIEEFLYTHPAIADVQVFGIPDEKYGEDICAWILKKPGHDVDLATIKEFCAGKIAHFKVPRIVRVVDEFPMTVTGKIQKFVMRDMMIEIMDQDAARIRGT
ncbi:MAG: AMP-binding protein [Sphingopyxis sp.]|nr:MAG: AMP-binding protein [Sphingopyxis sp.]